MKKDTSITALLGVTQQEAAMLLGISRSQLSMYESKQRGLPTHALTALAELLPHLQAPEKNASKPSPAALQKQSQETRQALEHLLQENEFQQMRLEREINAANQKQALQAKRAQLSELLASRKTDKANKKGLAPEPLIVAKASKTPNTKAVVIQQHRLDMLAMEKKLLESKLKQLQ